MTTLFQEDLHSIVYPCYKVLYSGIDELFTLPQCVCVTSAVNSPAANSLLGFLERLCVANNDLSGAGVGRHLEGQQSCLGNILRCDHL